MAELWDAYNKNFNKIENKTLIRGESIPDGAYHLVSEIVVKHTDGSYLLMQRDFRKHHGGKWELTAGGSALQGEDELEKDSIVLQEGETIGYKWVDKETMFKLDGNELASSRTLEIVKKLDL